MAKKTTGKSTSSSWWSDRHKILESIVEFKPTKPKAKKLAKKARVRKSLVKKPRTAKKTIKPKRVVSVKKITKKMTKVKKAMKAKKPVSKKTTKKSK
jgi:hypothetical protein